MNIADYLDAAILKPELSCEEALEAARACAPFKPKTLCMRPSDLHALSPVCREHGMGVCVVLGFPHGCQLTRTKVDEAKAYVDMGVDEIDMVCNIGWVRSGDWEAVRADIAAVVEVVRPAGVPLKVIFETCFLAPEEIRSLVEVCVEAGADFVKTSTGFNGEGAKEEDVRMMVETAAGRIRVKPSGGIRTPERARALIDMGADRLGVGSGSVAALCGGAAAEPGGGY